MGAMGETGIRREAGWMTGMVVEMLTQMRTNTVMYAHRPFLGELKELDDLD